MHPGGSNHYGGQVAFGPDGRLYASFGEATDGPAAQRSTPCSAARAGSPSIGPARRPRSWRTGSGTRGGSPSTARPATCTSAMWEKACARRSTASRAASAASRTSAGTSSRAAFATVDPKDYRPDLLPPAVQYPTRKGALRLVVGGYVYRGRRVPSLRGRYVYGDLCGGVWSVRGRRGERADTARSRCHRGGAARLGRTASGELLSSLASAATSTASGRPPGQRRVRHGALAPYGGTSVHPDLAFALSNTEVAARGSLDVPTALRCAARGRGRARRGARRARRPDRRAPRGWRPLARLQRDERYAASRPMADSRRRGDRAGTAVRDGYDECADVVPGRPRCQTTEGVLHEQPVA